MSLILDQQQPRNSYLITLRQKLEPITFLITFCDTRIGEASIPALVLRVGSSLSAFLTSGRSRPLSLIEGGLIKGSSLIPSTLIKRLSPFPHFGIVWLPLLPFDPHFPFHLFFYYSFLLYCSLKLFFIPISHYSNFFILISLVFRSEY